MQKRTIILMIICLASFGFAASAQNLDSTIEIRLNLLRPAKGGNVVTVSIINHSNEDIYLPNFFSFASGSVLHCYEKQPSGYREIFLPLEMYYDEFEKLIHDNQSRYNEKRKAVEDNPSFSPSEKKRLLDSLNANTETGGPGMRNHITSETHKQILGKEFAIRKQQKAIATAYCTQNDSAKEGYAAICNTQMYGFDYPVFLKAKDTLDIFGSEGVDYLFTKHADYKIAFNSEPRDTLDYNFNTGAKSVDRYPIYPEDIMGYKRFHGKGVISNVIYFSTKEGNKK